MPSCSRTDVLAFYRDLSLPIATKTNAGDWARLQEELQHLEAINQDLATAITKPADAAGGK
jgi:hypothetical protein